MRRVFWDTDVHVYWFEGNPLYIDRIQRIYHSMQQRGDILCGSSYVLGELLVGPWKRHRQDVVDRMSSFFTSHRMMYDYPPQAARIFAMLRADHGLKSLDALHLAIASAADADIFLTNDHLLHKISAPGLPAIATLDSDLF